MSSTPPTTEPVATRPVRVDLGEASACLHLLADPTRLRLLALLEQEELSVAELTAITTLSQSRVSTHLGKLREGGLVHDRREGTSRRYRLNAAMPKATARVWAPLRAALDDATVRADRARLQARRQGRSWAERVAGEMERHYSPGRTWAAYAHGLAAIAPRGDVLDIGCGDGFTAHLLAADSRSYTGIDGSAAVIDAACRRLDGAGDHIRFLLGDMGELPVPDESADLALLLHTLTFAEDPAQAIGEAARALREGGRLVLSTLAHHAHFEATAPYGHRHPGFRETTLRDLFLAAGLTPLQITRTTREPKAPYYETVTAVAHKPATRLAPSTAP